MSLSAPQDSSLTLTITAAGGLLIVRLRGPAGMFDAERLRQRLAELAEAETPKIVLDLSELTFLNSAGLGAFIAAHRRCRERGGMLCLVRPREAVAQLLRVTHLDRLIPVYPTLEAARANLGVSSA